MIKLFSKRTAPKARVLEHGTLSVGSKQFRRICAIHQDGTDLIAQGYEYDDALILETARLRASGCLPNPTDKRSVTLEDIALAYGIDGKDAFNERASGNTDTAASQKLFKLIEDAARMRASDIKIFTYDDKTVIRVKVAGRAQNFGTPWTPEEGLTAITFAFNARDGGGGHTTMQQQVLQSFSVSPKTEFPLPENISKLRGQKGYHESNTELGQHMVLRLFYTDDDPIAGDIDDLGFDDTVYAALKVERQSDQGCVIIGGSTGDGKSTTLIRLIDRLAEERHGCIDIVTVEDPVEYLSKSDAVTQIPVKSSGDGADRQAEYRATLMHAMRINPDVCIVSEIRDAAGAKEVLQFVASGHKVYTTIHVASANKILFRLIELGVPPAELAGGGDITLLMKQSLVPLLCPHCKIRCSAEDKQMALRNFGIALGPDASLRNNAGCSHCLMNIPDFGISAWAGYARLTAVAEFIQPDQPYFDFVGKHDEAGARAYWLRPAAQGGMGGTPLSDKLEQMVAAGQLDINDAIRVGLNRQLKKVCSL